MIHVKHYSKDDVKFIEMWNIYHEDEEYFRRNKIQISLEQLADLDIVAYACPEDDLTEESEVMILAGKDDCFTTMRRLKEAAMIRFGDVANA